MNRIAIFLLVLLIPLAAPAIAASNQNPFTGESEAPAQQPPTQSPRLFSFHTVLSKIALWQHQVREKMAEKVNQARRENSLRPIGLLLLLAFGYGSLHAAGPGHGKAIAMSYVIGQRPNYIRGLLFGTSIALIHGISGIVFVLILKFALNAGIAGTLGQVTRVTQLVSYALIALIGLVLLARSLLQWRNRFQRRRTGLPQKSLGNYSAAAIAIGMIPCPGVVMVVLFSISMGLVWLGVILGLAISLGMVITIGAVVTLVVAGKKAAMHRIINNDEKLIPVETGLAAGAGLLVAILGIFLFAAAI